MNWEQEHAIYQMLVETKVVEKRFAITIKALIVVSDHHAATDMLLSVTIVNLKSLKA